MPHAVPAPGGLGTVPGLGVRLGASLLPLAAVPGGLGYCRRRALPFPVN